MSYRLQFEFKAGYYWVYFYPNVHLYGNMVSNWYHKLWSYLDPLRAINYLLLLWLNISSGYIIF